MIQDFWNSIAGLKIDTAVAGAAGGIVRWATLREDWKSGLISILVGALCAHYLGEPAIGFIDGAIKWTGVTNSVSPGTAGFVVGLGGVGVSGFVLDFIRALRTRRADA